MFSTKFRTAQRKPAPPHISWASYRYRSARATKTTQRQLSSTARLQFSAPKPRETWVGSKADLELRSQPDRGSIYQRKENGSSKWEAQRACPSIFFNRFLTLQIQAT